MEMNFAGQVHCYALESTRNKYWMEHQKGSCQYCVAMLVEPLSAAGMREMVVQPFCNKQIQSLGQRYEMFYLIGILCM
jgi:hypothetical protein